MSSLAHYVQFTSVPSKNTSTFEEEFRADLEKTRKIVGIDNRIAEPILDALDGENLKIKFYAPVSKIAEISSGGADFSKFPILIIISGHVDFKLEKLGKKHNFPRGFPSLWWKNLVINFSGFRPKFKNDDRAQRFSVKAKGYGYSKKLSGYLGQALAFEMDGVLCWTACSKNSADAIGDSSHNGINYVADAARIYAPFMTQQVVEHMLKNNIHICSEILSFYDQNHGARVLKEMPVTTTAGLGVVVNLKEKTFRDLPTQKGFVTFMPFKDLIDMCLALGLPVCEAVIVTGKAGEELFNLLQDSRDFLTDELYNKILAETAAKYPSLVHIIEGNTTHADVLGDILEGLVVQAIIDNEKNSEIITTSQIIEALNSGIGEVFKFKLENYVSRTMGLRQITLGAVKLSDCDTHIKNHVEHWSLTKEGRDHWYRFLWQCVINFGKVTDGRYEMPARKAASTDVGLHIQIADSVAKLGISENIGEQIIEICRSNLSLEGPYTLVIPFADDKMIHTTAKTIEEKTGYFTTTKAQRPKRKTIRGWVQVTKNLLLPTDATGPVFLMPVANESSLQAWQEKKLSEFEQDSHYSDIHQVTDVDEFTTSLNRVLTTQHEALLADDRISPEVSQMELNIQDGAQTAFTRCCVIIDERIAVGKISTIILVGLQASGKSTIVRRLIEKYGDKIAHCSADIHMGEKFNPLMIERVHKLCQMDCFKALRENRFPIIDNTSLIAEHRSVYHHISSSMGAGTASIAVAGDCWIYADEAQRTLFVDALEVRANKRTKGGGKIIERHVIENALAKAVIDINEFTKHSHVADDWLSYYPKISPNLRTSIDSQTLKYRSPSLREKCETLFQAYAEHNETVGEISPEKMQEMRLQYEIMRGVDDFYMTVINPMELRKIMKDYKKRGEKFPNPKDIVIEGEPEVVGLGQVTSDDGKHAIFAVVEWEGAQNYRACHNLGRKHLHVTLAFEKDDVHRDQQGNSVDKSKVMFTV